MCNICIHIIDNTVMNFCPCISDTDTIPILLFVLISQWVTYSLNVFCCKFTDVL